MYNHIIGTPSIKANTKDTNTPIDGSENLKTFMRFTKKVYNTHDNHNQIYSGSPKIKSIGCQGL
jgi:hypothetical protein